MISKDIARYLYASKYVEVRPRTRMHFIEEGSGNPILFLHGIPTSCYLWRYIIPYLSSLGRCIAPDLIGLGNSDKPDIKYSISDHIYYIEKFIETLNLKNITLVMHGWGSIIGFDYAMRHSHNCNGLVFYEAFLRPQHDNAFSDDDISLPFLEYAASLQKQENIVGFSINGTHLVDMAIRQGMMHQLTEEEMDLYRRSFSADGASKPILQHIRELPGGSDICQVDQIIVNYSKELTQSKLPKLLLYSVPGFIMTMATVIWAKEHFPNLEIAEIGEELHFAQESHPQLMGESISAWLQSIEQLYWSR